MIPREEFLLILAQEAAQVRACHRVANTLRGGAWRKTAEVVALLPDMDGDDVRDHLRALRVLRLAARDGVSIYARWHLTRDGEAFARMTVKQPPGPCTWIYPGDRKAKSKQVRLLQRAITLHVYDEPFILTTAIYEVFDFVPPFRINEALEYLHRFGILYRAFHRNPDGTSNYAWRRPGLAMPDTDSRHSTARTMETA